MYILYRYGFLISPQRPGRIITLPRARLFYHPAMQVHYFTTATDEGGSRGVDVGQEDMQQKSDVTQNLRANLRTQASL